MTRDIKSEYMTRAIQKYIGIAILMLTLLGVIFFPRLALEFNRTRWKLLGPSHYRYELRLDCRCTNLSLMPFKVEVLDGKILSMTDVNGQRTSKGYSMDGLFDLIQKELYQARMTRVKYDTRYGFPVVIMVDKTSAIDDEQIYTINSFEVLP